MELEAGKITELHHEIKKKRPVIHCITNAVTVNDCANIPVSYTHLDVYKRQEYSSILRFIRRK